MDKEFETITLEMDKDEYEALEALAEKNNTTLNEIINNLLTLCVKENGLVVWNDGFDKPYTVLRTKEEVAAWKAKFGE
jgi:hypothetical protein